MNKKGPSKQTICWKPLQSVYQSQMPVATSCRGEIAIYDQSVPWLTAIRQARLGDAATLGHLLWPYDTATQARTRGRSFTAAIYLGVDACPQRSKGVIVLIPTSLNASTPQPSGPTCPNSVPCPQSATGERRRCRIVHSYHYEGVRPQATRLHFAQGQQR